jgi:predicted aldo/keto reductase-like oxidoreductase
MDRREFLRATATGVAAAAMSASAPTQAASESHAARLPQRVLGKTRRRLSIVGMGGIVVMGNDQAHANRLVSEAFEKGVIYYDVAPSYGDGEAEEKLGPALEPYRKRCFLACKTGRRDKAGAEEELNRSLQRLRTDHFDLYQLHGLTRMEELDQALSNDGAIRTFEAARKDGRIRHVGFSAHSVEVALAAMDRYPFDTILFPINFVLYTNANFGPQVVAKAKEKGMGILALKSMARQPWPQGVPHDYPKCWYQPISNPEDAALAVRFTLSQPITAMVPPGDERLFRMALNTALGFKPLTTAEQTVLRQRAEGLTPIFRLAA